MRFLTSSVTLLSLYTNLALAASADDWRTRSIYQIVTDRFARTDGSTSSPCNTADKKYCGGTFQGIMSQLDYIQGMGFTAIWISPVVKGIENSTVGSGYHGFWQQDLNTINPHFGTADDLKQLSDAVHKRGMLLMVDILANNFAAVGSGASVDYSKFSPPFNNKAMFHPYCPVTNYSDVTNYQNCWLGNDEISLPDVNTELPEVQTYFADWASKMAKDYSIDGFRIDATKHVPKSFWNTLQSKVGAYMIGEVFDSDASLVCNYMVQSLNAVLNFPLMFGITATFGDTTHNASDVQYYLANLTTNCRDPTLMGTFTENQDVQRFGAVTTDIAQRKSALTFAMTGDGVPIVYYGAEQGFTGKRDPDNREALWLSGFNTSNPLYNTVRGINYARNALVKQNINDTYFSPYWHMKSKLILRDNNATAVRKGSAASMVSVMSNKGSKSGTLGPYVISDTNWLSGVEIMDVLSCKRQTTREYGNFDATIVDGEPQVWVPSSYLEEDFRVICPDAQTTAGKKAAKSAGHRAKAGLPNWTLAVVMACLVVVMS